MRLTTKLGLDTVSPGARPTSKNHDEMPLLRTQ